MQRKFPQSIYSKFTRSVSNAVLTVDFKNYLLLERYDNIFDQIPIFRDRYQIDTRYLKPCPSVCGIFCPSVFRGSVSTFDGFYRPIFKIIFWLEKYLTRYLTDNYI